MKIEQQLCSIINEILNTNYEESEMDGVELQNLGFDSLLFVRLLLQMEETFEIQVDEQDLVKPIQKTYNGLLEYIINKKCV